MTYVPPAKLAALAGSPTWDAVGNKPASFPPSSHTHAIADVNALGDALDGKEDSGAAAFALAGHLAAADPHPAYLTADEGDLRYAAIGAGGGGGDPWTWATLGVNVVNSTNVLADVTGMSFAALANTTYLIELVGVFQTAATTTGIAVALDIPSGDVRGLAWHATSASAMGSCEQIADNATTGATTGVRAANTPTLIDGRWKVVVGATPGNIVLRFRSEVSGSAVTMNAGTLLGRRVIA